MSFQGFAIIDQIFDGEIASILTYTLIAVHTAGVGGWDANIRAGWWPFGRPSFPIVLGTDGSDTIAAVGSRVRRFRRGQKVYSYAWNNPQGGFYAEYVAVPAENVAVVPEILDLRQAGATGTAGLTALHALHLRKGQSVIIHGAQVRRS